MGRQARGVRGIRLRSDDHVVDMLVARDPEGTVLTACERGYGKRTPVSDYPVKNRGGQGVINIKKTARNGPVVGLALCKDGDDVVLMTTSGMIVRSPVSDLRPMGRNTAGVRIINLKEDDALVGAEVVDASDIELVDAGEAQHMAIDPAEEAAARAEGPEPEPEDDEPDDDEAAEAESDGDEE
jgi:DNA gyrase subunit A